jgi:hypothetical protein
VTSKDVLVKPQYVRSVGARLSGMLTLCRQQLFRLPMKRVDLQNPFFIRPLPGIPEHSLMSVKADLLELRRLAVQLSQDLLDWLMPAGQHPRISFFPAVYSAPGPGR